MPGVSEEASAETLDFWRRMRDQAGTAALDSIGGNSTLAAAQVTFRLLHPNMVLASPKQRARKNEHPREVG